MSARVTSMRREATEVMVISDDSDGSDSMHIREVHQSGAKLTTSPAPLLHDDGFSGLLAHLHKKTSRRTLQRIFTEPSSIALHRVGSHQESSLPRSSPKPKEYTKEVPKPPSPRRHADVIVRELMPSPPAHNKEAAPLVMSSPVPSPETQTAATRKSQLLKAHTRPAATKASHASSSTRTQSARNAPPLGQQTSKTLPAKAVVSTDPHRGSALKNHSDIPHNDSRPIPNPPLAVANKQAKEGPVIASPAPRFPVASAVQRRAPAHNRSPTILFEYEEPSMSVQFNAISEEPEVLFFAEDGQLLVSQSATPTPPPPCTTTRGIQSCVPNDSSASELVEDYHFIELSTPPAKVSPHSTPLLPSEGAHVAPVRSVVVAASTKQSSASVAALEEPVALRSGPRLISHGGKLPSARIQPPVHADVAPPFRCGLGGSRPASPATSRSHTPRTPRTTIARIAPKRRPAAAQSLPARQPQRSPRTRAEVQRPTPAFINIGDLESVEQERRGEIVGRESAISAILLSHATKEMAAIQDQQFQACIAAEAKRRGVVESRWVIDLQLEVEPLLLQLCAAFKRECLQCAVLTAGSVWIQSAQRVLRLEIMCAEGLSFGSIVSQQTSIARRWEDNGSFATDSEVVFFLVDDEVSGGTSNHVRSNSISPQFTVVSHDDDVDSRRAEELHAAALQQRLALTNEERSHRHRIAGYGELHKLCANEAEARRHILCDAWRCVTPPWAGMLELVFRGVLLMAYEHFSLERTSTAHALESVLRGLISSDADISWSFICEQEEEALRARVLTEERTDRLSIAAAHTAERELWFHICVAQNSRRAIMHCELREWKSLTDAFEHHVPSPPVSLRVVENDERTHRRSVVESYIAEYSTLCSTFAQERLHISLLTSNNLFSEMEQ